ncbi:MAG: hypothetical protein L0H93_03535 [Nocardioides sp.]|nr:hypothetical protein [Nocardioides sp.]
MSDEFDGEPQDGAEESPESDDLNDVVGNQCAGDEVTGDLPPGQHDTERTGNQAVDRVLDSLDALGDQPVDEHVAVFENAHSQLRKALDGANNGIADMPRPGN